MKFFNGYTDRQGVPTYNYGYGWMLMARLRNNAIVQRLVDFINYEQARDPGRGIIGIGHSNGCEILWKTAQRCPQVRGLVFINAALNTDVQLPPSLGFVHNWYSPSDWVVKLADCIPLHPWGALGAMPYRGVSTMVTDYNKEQDFEQSSKTHSDVFRVQSLREFFLPLILNRARKAYRQLDADA